MQRVGSGARWPVARMLRSHLMQPERKRQCRSFCRHGKLVVEVGGEVGGALWAVAGGRWVAGRVDARARAAATTAHLLSYPSRHTKLRAKDIVRTWWISCGEMMLELEASSHCCIHGKIQSKAHIFASYPAKQDYRNGAMHMTHAYPRPSNTKTKFQLLPPLICRDAKVTMEIPREQKGDVLVSTGVEPATLALQTSRISTTL
ncbi:hypothetical protein EJ06DRAFT_327734 [Trichodelitschia bisporula]|uniref:Uncharacterized protein n=1 Tax=Trichodelitschia bisporula TaxID=703511 RepID=A0A6G1I1N2_9PEZI|nr:hypothetical protein EJ06DRAFT_327734 [Trichodelitschia bisporula]